MNKLKPTAVDSLLAGMNRERSKSDRLRDYFANVDLSSGKELFSELSKICDWYDEVIENKRHFVNNSIREILEASNEEHLVIILAAGNYPHSLEILHEYCDKVNRIIEIDKDGMEEKQELYDRFFPECAEKTKCISADITSKTILDVVSQLINEYYQKMPCLVLLDNASYFLKIADIQNIISSFKSSNKRNTLILESLRPFNLVSPERRKIPESIFNSIRTTDRESILTSLNHHTLAGIFNEIEGTLKKSSDLVKMEKERVGENKLFNSPEEGWLECSVWEI